MGIPILDELNNELSRLYVAGSSLAKGDPRLKKYIPTLQKLGEKAPVFQALALKLEALTNGDEKDAPENIMEASMILYSVLYTQGSTDTKEYTTDVEFSQAVHSFRKIPYSTLHKMIRTLAVGNGEHDDSIKELYESELYKDLRLYEAYVNCIGDKRTYISDYVESTIIPSIGNDMMPFIEKEFNIEGTKRDARLFRIMYSILNKDIVPFALKAVEIGSEPVKIEALYSLCEDKSNEEILLSYTKDKKGDIKRAALTSLVKLESQEGDKIILDGLKKVNIAYLYEPLILSDNPIIAEAILAEVKKEMPEYIKKSSKIKLLLEIIVKREEKEGWEYIKSILTDLEFYEKASGVLELYTIGEMMEQEHEKEKDTLLYDICCENEIFNELKVSLAVRMFSKEKAYEELKDMFKKSKSDVRRLIYHLFMSYMGSFPHRGFYREVIVSSDNDKKWDRRWANLLLDMCDEDIKNGVDNLYLIASFIYNDEEDIWMKIMEKLLKALNSSRNYVYYDYIQVLACLFKNNHPASVKFYNDFLGKGRKQEDIIRIFVQYDIDLKAYNLQ